MQAMLACTSAPPCYAATAVATATAFDAANAANAVLAGSQPIGLVFSMSQLNPDMVDADDDTSLLWER